MSTPSENTALTAELSRLAQSHVDQSPQTYATTFDYSEAGLASLDEVISRFHPDGQVPDQTLLAVGAYVGESIRRSLGGVWVQDERGVALLQRIGGGNASASPFSWVQKRLAGGMSASIAQHYAALKQQLGQVGVAIATAAAPDISEMTAEENEVLMRAPLHVFMAVAAADGKIDKKELSAFEKIITSVMMGATPLLRETMAAMLPDMERHLDQMSQLNPVEDLRRAAQILDTRFPDEAPAFKQALVAIGVKIANSSGGFLGLGSKISKDEAQAIGGIAVILGVPLE